MSKVIGLRATGKVTGVCVPLIPGITPSPASLGFPATPQNGTAAPATVTLTNAGTAGLRISSLGTRDIPVSEGSVFGIVAGSNCLGTTIPPGGSCTASIDFRAFGNPGQTINGALDVFSNAPGSPTVVALSGIVGTPALTAVSAIDFGGVPTTPGVTATLPLSITNTGTIAVAVTSVPIGAFGFPAVFSLSTGTCPLLPDGVLSFNLAPGTGCAFDVIYSPSGFPIGSGTIAPQFANAFVSIGYANAATPAIALSSTFTSLQGVGVGPGGSLDAFPSTLFLGDLPQNTSTSASVTLTNLAGASQSIAIATSRPEIVIPAAGNLCSSANLPAGLAAGASCTFDVVLNRGGLPAQPYNESITVTGSVSGSSLVSLPFVVIPGLAFTPASQPFAPVDFGVVAYGGSTTLTFTLSNTDPFPYTFPTSIPPFALFPPFAATGGTCGLGAFTLPAGQSCTVDVTFAPTPADGGPGFSADGYVVAPSPSNRFIDMYLSGTVSGPQLSLSTTFNDFGTDNPGVVSLPYTVTVTNFGDQPASISIPAPANPDFIIANNLCTGPVAANGGTCAFDIQYLRSVPGLSSTTISVETVPPFSTATIFVTGEAAVVAPPPAQLEYYYPPSTAAPLAFPPTVVGIPSLPLEISVGNTGGLPLGLGTIVSSAPAEFSVVSTCPIVPAGAVAPGACCLLTVVFTPVATGPRAATITVLDPQGVTLATISLAGPGQSPTAPGIAKQFSPNPIQAGGVSALTISITNLNAFALTSAGFTDAFPSGLVVAPAPAITNTCGGAVSAVAGGSSISLAGGTIPAAGASPGACAVTVQVTAAAVSPGLVNVIPPGAAPGGLVTAETTAAPSATATLVVSSVPAPSVVLNPPSLAFGSQTVFVPSAIQTVTVQNVGTADLNVSSVTVAGDFSIQTACTGVPVPPAGQCAIDTRFTPVIGGLRTGQITVASNAPGSPNVASLSGTGVVQPLPNVSLSPLSLAFPTTPAGQVSAPQVVTLTNTGGGPLAVLAVDLVGPGFTRTHNCGATLASLASCQILVVFSPPTAGGFAATLRIVSDAPGSPSYLGVTGSASASAAGRLTAPASISFNDQIVNTASAPQALTITNAGNAMVSISRISVTGDFVLDGSCFDLRVGESCALRVTFLPAAAGVRTGQVAVESDASNAVFGIALNGRGVPVPAPKVSLSATSLGYGNTALGAAPALPLTITNTGTADLVVTSILATGDFRVTGSCTATMAPGASCRIEVDFAPSIPGARTGELRVFSNAPENPAVAALSGMGCRLFSIVGNRAGELSCGP